MSFAPELSKYFKAGIYRAGKCLTNGWNEFFYRNGENGPVFCAFRRGEDGPFLHEIMQLPQFANVGGQEQCMIAIGQSVVNGTEYKYCSDGRSVETVVKDEDVA